MWLLDKIYGVDDAQAKSNELDAKHAELNQRKLDKGEWTQAQYDQAQANLDAGRLDVSGGMETAFLDGAKEGAQAEIKLITETIPGAVNSTLSGAVGSIWRAIPLSIWIIAGVALFIYLGGASVLRAGIGHAAKRINA